MRLTVLAAAAALAALAPGSHTIAAGAGPADEVIRLERAALDRWGAGDPGGYLDVYAPDITYFDVATPRRIDGHAAMAGYYQPFTGKIKIASYEMIGPKVQRRGDVAVLTYNLRSNVVQADGRISPVFWNSTAVYARDRHTWKIVHSHWSITAPQCLRGTM